MERSAIRDLRWSRGSSADSNFKQHVVFTHSFAISPAHTPRGIHLFPALSGKGRRECRAPDAPDSRVCNGVVKNAHALVRSHRNHPAFPTQWFTDYGVLSPVLRAFWPPSPALLNANLTPAFGVPGPHVFSVRKQARSSMCHPRPPHPAPRLVTTAKRPFWWDGTGRNIG
jgi:hypothetical protein